MARTTTSRVEPHPDTHLDAVGATYRFRVLAHGSLHGQGGVAGPQGVVLVGQRRSKSHNAVAQYLVYCALEAMYGIHHSVQGRI